MVHRGNDRQSPAARDNMELAQFLEGQEHATGESRPPGVAFIQNMIERALARWHLSQRTDSELEQAIKQHMALPQVEQLCNSFSSNRNRPHRGILSTICNYRGSNPPLYLSDASENSSWSVCLHRLWSEISHNHDATCQVMILFGRTPDIEQKFSFVEKLAAFSHTRLQKLISTTRDIILLAIAAQWDLSPSFIAVEKDLLDSRQSTASPAWRPNFPSEPTGTEHGPWVVEKNSFSLSFEYPTKSTHQEYVSDIHTYVFRPFSRQPRLEKLNISIFKNASTAAHRVLLVTNAAKNSSKWSEAVLEGISTLPWKQNVFKIFTIILLHMKQQYTNFLENASADLIQTAADGRIYPSGSKIHHLLHLEDCRKSVLKSCEESIKTISHCVEYLHTQMTFPLTQDQHTDFKELEKLSGDMVYLKKELRRFKNAIGIEKKVTRDQLELAQVRRSSVLTVLAGLYIPLAFVSSFFGMNVRQFSGDATEVEKVVNVDPNNYIVTVGPETAQNTTVTGGNQSFELKYFWAISIPLTFFTILFPLIAGAIIRSGLKLISKGGPRWRVLFAFSSLLLLESTGFTGATPDVVQEWSVGGHWETARFVIGVFTSSLFALIFFWNFTQASLRRNWQATIYWCGQTALLLLVVILPQEYWYDELIYGKPHDQGFYYFLSYCGGILYWLFHGVGWWFRPEWYYRWDERRPKTKVE